MPSYNRIILAGNLTRDPELKYLKNGTAVCQGGIAVNRVWKTEEGEKKEDVCFVEFVVWGRQAENFVKFTSKGSTILLEGALRFEQWEKDDEKRSKHVVNVEMFQFLDRKEQEK